MVVRNPSPGVSTSSPGSTSVGLRGSTRDPDVADALARRLGIAVDLERLAALPPGTLGWPPAIEWCAYDDRGALVSKPEEAQPSYQMPLQSPAQS